MKTRFLKYTNRLKKYLTNGKSGQFEQYVPDHNIPEISPLNCRESHLKEKRLNLLIPALSLRFSFGGINTALDFFLNLIGDAEEARIIITDEAESDLLGFAQAKSWQLLNSDEADRYGKTIICFGDRYNKNIPIRSNDVFVATAWWTAYNGERILSWQREKWKREPLPLVYLIQDFEPGFYKWSSRYLLALSTYYQKNMIAIVNTSLLCDYIKFNGITFNHYYIFEPTLNKSLARQLLQKEKYPKKRKIIFYGRPSVERNAYEMIIKGLEYWSVSYPHARSWEVISLGEVFSNIQLGNGIEVSVKGKMSLEEYGNMLLESAIGISLMVSPHPSYPPLEMAAFDLGVITNKFFNKNLAAYHDNLFSLESTNPENIAILLGELCNKFEDNASSFLNKKFRNTNFLDNKNEFSFIDDLRQQIKK